MIEGMFGRSAIIIAGVSLVTAPAMASDETKAGLLAGLGVAAATGKTSLEGSAGAIEAGLLSAEAFRQSADIIAGVAAATAGARKVVLIGEKDSIDLISPRIIMDQIVAARGLLAEDRNRPCPKIPATTPASSPGTQGMLGDFPIKGFSKITPADAAGAVITETSINGLELPRSDNRMTNALMMVQRARSLSSAVDGGWRTPSYADAPSALSMTVANEVVGWSAASPVRNAYRGLVADLAKPGRACKDDKQRQVQDDRTKAVVQDAKELAEGLIDAKDGASVLARAIQAEAFVNDDSNQDPEAKKAGPVIVRTAIEQVGGTSIARSGVLYTFGWPNAATVNAGLLVSFRVIDPGAAKLIAIGEVRCMTAQTNIKQVRDHLRHAPGTDERRPKEQTVCDYRATRIS